MLETPKPDFDTIGPNRTQVLETAELASSLIQ
jgi:hypothetical protein